MEQSEITAVQPQSDTALERLSRIVGCECPCGGEIILRQEKCRYCGGEGWVEVEGVPTGSKTTKDCEPCHKTGIMVDGACCSDCDAEFPDCDVAKVPLDEIPENDGKPAIISIALGDGFFAEEFDAFELM